MTNYQNFNQLIDDITRVLQIEDQKQELYQLTRDYDLSKADPTLLAEISRLIESDTKLANFETSYIKTSGDPALQSSYDSLKKNLSKMQVLVYQNAVSRRKLIERIKIIAPIPQPKIIDPARVSPTPPQEDKTNEILKAFIDSLNEKVDTVNTILDKTIKADNKVEIVEKTEEVDADGQPIQQQEEGSRKQEDGSRQTQVPIVSNTVVDDQRGGSHQNLDKNNSYFNKYLKYKRKYLNLKKTNN